MNDPEDILRGAPLAAPSSALEQRIQSAFAEAAQARRKASPPPIWRWVGGCAAAGIAAAVVLVVTRTGTSRPSGDTKPASIQCEIGAPEPLRALLLESPAHERTPPRFFVTVSTP
ncbi:MAG TPA: hypothetical protein VHD32_13080 [Candidatus Didemnitutus sp.]|nr:hypothetical protein [Candidatus Didemnitutus sp.]